MEKNHIAFTVLLVTLLAFSLFQSAIPSAYADVNANNVCDHLGGLSEPFLGTAFDIWTASGVQGYYSSPYSTWDGFWQGGVGAYPIAPDYPHPYDEVGPLTQGWYLSGSSGANFNYTLAAEYANIHLLEPRDVWCPGWYNKASWLGNSAGGSSFVTVAADDTFNFNNGSNYYTIYGRHASIPYYRLLQTAAPQVQETQRSQHVDAVPLFDVQITYAYIGPRTDDFACPNPFQNQKATSLNAVSLYPALICLNAKYVSNATSEVWEAAIEVYQVQVTTDTGVTERYIFTVGTNTDPAFSNVTALSRLRPEIEKLAGQFTNAAYGYFNLNLSVGDSISRITSGSVGSFQSDPSGLGFWSSGKPTSATLTVQRLGCILMNEKSVSIYYSNSQASPTQVQLANYSDGLLYNTAVPQNQMDTADPFTPLI